MRFSPSLMSTSTKHTLSSLPLAPANLLLPRNLVPDPEVPDVQALRELQKTRPSLMRRARLMKKEAHYSFVTPFVAPFPYNIEPPSPSDDEVNKGEVNKGEYIEKWLGAREAVDAKSSEASNDGMRLQYPNLRPMRRELIGLSETGLRDCLPHLEVGDAFTSLGVPMLSQPDRDDNVSEFDSDDKAIKSREELVDVLSGFAVLTSGEDSGGFGPFSMRYSGHQFGEWAGQLGDGRAITVHVTPHPSDSSQVTELQLKGAGRTPFSRTADGLAVLRSSIREYLCSEAMQALDIPTTRSLSLVSLPDIPVSRERVETACVLTRMAPSFLRIGNFEAFNPPSQMFFFGGGQQAPDYEGLRALGDWVSGKVLKVRDEGSEEPWGANLVREVAERNARMVARWQAYGFMHGVMNTDNISVLGLTIDYGPYAFMDKFDAFHICNHSDSGGRYSYKYQPSMIIYAVNALLKALSPLVGAELESGKAVSKGWTENASEEQLKAWSDKGLGLKSEMESLVVDVCAKEYGSVMRKRLGLRKQEQSDEREISKPLLDLMEDHGLDFHLTFRSLCTFRPSVASSEELKLFVGDKILANCPEPDRLDRERAEEEFSAWLKKYGARIDSEKDLWGGSEFSASRESEMKKANPRFVLRQWVLEEVIKRCEEDVDVGKRVLAKVLHMACYPFEAWGGEDLKRDEDKEMDKEQKEERRFCGMGDTGMLGFQCSCSS